MYQLNEKEFPCEMRLKAAVGTLNTYLATYSIEIYKRYGEDGLKMIYEIWSQMADKFFPISFEKLGFNGDQPKDIAEWFAKADAIVGYETDFFIISKNKAGFRVNKCPWYKNRSKEGSRICSEGVIGFEKRAAELLNPKIKVSMAKFFHNGDNCCEYIFEIPED